MSAPRFSVRRATDEDQDSILRLLSEMRGQDARRRLTSLYGNNPHGHATSWVAIDRDSCEVVGVASVFPREVLVDGVPTLGCIGGDCFVAPKARRQGLATRLHRTTRADMTALGIEFVYGPASPANLRALIRAGSREVTTFGRFVRPLASRFFGDHFSKVLPRWSSAISLGLAPYLLGRAAFFVFGGAGAPGSGLASEPTDRFGSEWDEWYEANAPASGVFCSRDSAYLNHRYGTTAPDTLKAFTIRREGTLEGMFALRFDDRRRTCQLMDMVTRFELDAMRAGLRLASRSALDLGCDSLGVRSTPHALFGRALAAEGFLERDRTAPWKFPLLVPESLHVQGPLFDGEAWYFLEGDLDGEYG